MVPRHGFESLEGASLFLEDDLGRLRPHERLGIGVVMQEIVVDGGLERGDAHERAAADALSRDLGEEALDEVQPRGAGRREVELEAGVLFEPSLHVCLEMSFLFPIEGAR